ncbi:MAG TPA: DUF885 family protein [Caulobacteraceae bacterium]
MLVSPPAAAGADGRDAALRALLDEAGAPQGRSPATTSHLLSRIHGLRSAALSAEGMIERAAAVSGLETEAALRQLFPFGRIDGAVSPYVVHPRAGAHLRAAAEADVAATVEQLDSETEQMRLDAARGVVPPRMLLDRTIAQVRTTRAAIARPELAAALERQANALKALRERARADGSVRRLRDGDAYYALSLSAAGGMPVRPSEARRLGLAWTRDLQAQADSLLQAQGLHRGGVAERLRALAGDTRWLYRADDAGKAGALADMNGWLDIARARLPRAFHGARDVAAEVRRIPPADEARGRGGERVDGAYYVDLREIRRRPRWTLRSVVHHELLPGHLLQTGLARRPAHRALARYAPGYSEGWATYAEQLAEELGLFEDDPLGRIGYLQWMLFRVGRLVVDTGIHVEGWSRERAIAELRELQGDPVAFITLEEDVDRMFMQPGAAAGQALATAELLRMRRSARAALGSRFDLAGFHQAVLARGPLPFAGLREALDLWASGRRG